MHKVDVAIVGAGPAGLATAISIKRACRNLDVKVYERVPSITPRGAGIQVEVNGAKALEAIDPALHAALLNTGRNPKSRMVFDQQGELASIEPMGGRLEQEFAKWGYNSFFLGWSDMQQTMADHLDSVAEPDTLQLGTRFDSMRVEEDGVLLDFGGTAPPVKARVVLGADGYRSKVRQLWLDDGPPEFAGTVIWRGLVPEEACPVAPDSLAFSVKGGTALTVYSGNKGWVVWNGSATVDAMQQAGVAHLGPSSTPQTSVHARENASRATGAEIKERALKMFQHQPRLLREVMQASAPEVLMEHDICFRPSAKIAAAGPLGSGPISLVGDAAHAKRPNGQGLNQTFEDALELGHCLRAEGPTEAALRAYESARMARWKFSAAASEANAKKVYFGAGALTKEEAAVVMELPEVRERLWGLTLKPLVA